MSDFTGKRFIFLVVFLFAQMTKIWAASFYISASQGNDSWSGTLAVPNTSNTDGPFRTLAVAQLAMRNSPTIKTTTLRAGTYSLQSTPMTLNTNDTGETWIAYPCETVILDGGGNGYFYARDADNLTLQGLTFQNMAPSPSAEPGDVEIIGDNVTLRWNTFKNCQKNCLFASLQNSSVDSNHFQYQSPGNIQGSVDQSYDAMVFNYGTSNTRVTHNLIEDCEGGGIAFANGNNNPTMNGNIIDRNLLRNVNTSAFDSGALYMYDSTHTGGGHQITNNVIDGNGGANHLTSQTKAIYLDTARSNVLVSGNICRDCGQFAVQFHAGDHNTIRNNIFDLSDGARFGQYQKDPNYDQDPLMDANLIEHNILYFADTAPSPLWVLGLDSEQPPTVATNLYYSATGSNIHNTAPVVDTNFVNANPMFVNAPGGDYSMPSNSPAFRQIGFQALPTDQGPLPSPDSCGVMASILSLSVGALSFNATVGGDSPASQAVAVHNTGGGTLAWIADKGSATWLSLSHTSGGNSQTMNVAADVSGLSAGTYNATITVSDPNATNSPQSVLVTFTVNSPSSVSTLPDPDTRLWPDVFPVNGQLSVGYPPEYIVTFNWTITPVSITAGIIPASAASSASNVASFTTSFPQASLTSHKLAPGRYQIQIQAQDSQGRKSNIVTKTIGLVAANLSYVNAYPNPWRSDRHRSPSIIFDGLIFGTTLKIFTVSGHKIKEVHTDGPLYSWNRTNESGDTVGSGIYLYVVTDDKGNKVRGNFAVIK